MLGPRQVAQPPLAEIAQSHAIREMIAHHLARRQREQRLPAVRRREEARDAIERRPEIIAVAKLRRASVQRHPHLDRADFLPRLRV